MLSFNIDIGPTSYSKSHNEVNRAAPKEVKFNNKEYVAKNLSSVLHSIIAFFSKKTPPSNIKNEMTARTLNFEEFNKNRTETLKKSLNITPRTLNFEEFNKNRTEALKKSLNITPHSAHIEIELEVMPPKG